MKLTNVRKKRTTKYDKNIVTCDVGTTQCKDEMLKVRKKEKEIPNMTKVLSNVMLELCNVRMESSNVRKNKGTTKCDKRTGTCNVGIIQYEDETVKCEKKN